jgi:hypothetical protein
VAEIFEEEKKDLSVIARKVEEQTKKEIQANIERFKERNRKKNLERYGCDCFLAKCYVSCPRYLIHAEPEIFFTWWAKTSPPDSRIREYLQPIPAPPAKSGGSRNKKKRKMPKTSVFYNPYL